MPGPVCVCSGALFPGARDRCARAATRRMNLRSEYLLPRYALEYLQSHRLFRQQGHRRQTLPLVRGIYRSAPARRGRPPGLPHHKQSPWPVRLGHSWDALVLDNQFDWQLRAPRRRKQPCRSRVAVCLVPLVTSQISYGPQPNRSSLAMCQSLSRQPFANASRDLRGSGPQTVRSRRRASLHLQCSSRLRRSAVRSKDDQTCRNQSTPFPDCS